MDNRWNVGVPKGRNDMLYKVSPKTLHKANPLNSTAKSSGFFHSIFHYRPDTFCGPISGIWRTISPMRLMYSAIIMWW